MYEQITTAKEKQQKLLLMGDFNCKVGERIVGNGKEISKSGKIFLKTVKNNKLLILNEPEKCSGLSYGQEWKTTREVFWTTW
jgi:hypothetical protein